MTYSQLDRCIGSRRREGSILCHRRLIATHALSVQRYASLCKLPTIRTTYKWHENDVLCRSKRVHSQAA